MDKTIRNWRFIAVVTSVLVAAAVLLLKPLPLLPEQQGLAGAASDDINSLAEAEALTDAQIAAQQAQAEHATLATLGSPDVTAPVTSRPAYVSPVEWLVLKRVAAQDEAPQESLAQLVNKLRFSKQVELWQSYQGARRMALGEQLLRAIPGQVEQRDLARADAHQLQRRVLYEIEPDPVRRQQRLQQQAQRIGVQFEVGEG